VVEGRARAKRKIGAGAAEMGERGCRPVVARVAWELFFFALERERMPTRCVRTGTTLFISTQG
jgi:hypothetical protein